MTTVNNEVKTPQNFVAYEYKTMAVSRKLASVFVDCYPSFGWSLDDSIFYNHSNRVTLTFKRNRQMKNKPEINKFQRQFEQGIENITHLEDTKKTRASIIAMSVGMVGAAFMAGATFSFLAGNIVLCIILAIPGFFGWGVAYQVFRHFSKKRAEEVVSLVDREYDSIYSSCEKANTLFA